MRVLFFLTVLVFATPSTASVKEAFSGASYKGQLRAHSDFVDHNGDFAQYGNAFGGFLGFETDATQLMGFSLGATYMTSNDLGTNRALASERLSETPTVDINTLGEAFVRLRTLTATVTAGRQIINTPFSNEGVNEILPITYTGYSLVSQFPGNIKAAVYYLLRTKDYLATDFQNVGQFALTTLGNTAKDTRGLTVAGIEVEGIRGHWGAILFSETAIWYYLLPDVMELLYLEGQKEIALRANTKLFYKAQVATSGGHGEELAGADGGFMMGLLLGAKMGHTTVFGAYNKVRDARLLAPFATDDDPLYSSGENLSLINIDAGDGYKIAVEHELGNSFKASLSWAAYEFDSGKDMNELAAEAEYNFSGEYEGLALRLIYANQNGDNFPTGFAKLSKYRAQLQYDF